MAAQTQVRTIIVKADTKGNQQLRQMAKDLGFLNQNVSSISKSMSLFSKLAGFSFLGFGVRQIMDMSDSIQTLKDRLKILTGSSEAASSVFEKLQGVASRTKTSVSDLGTIYARMGAATKDLGVNTSQLIRFTEILQNTFRLSGATATEATAAAIQMSQGFASGQLRGQELRSVLEANVYIGQILSDTFGVTRGELYKLAEAGKLTADKVFMAILKNGDKVNESAKNLSQTFDNSLTVAMDRLRTSVSKLNEDFGISAGLAKALEYVIENADKLTKVIVALSVSVAAVKIAKFLAGLTALGATLTTLGGKIMYVITSLITFAQLHPLIATITAAVLALAAAFAYLDTETLIDIWEKFRNVLGSVVNIVGTGVSAFLTLFELFTGPRSIYEPLKKYVDELDRYISVSEKASRAGKNFAESLEYPIKKDALPLNLENLGKNIFQFNAVQDMLKDYVPLGEDKKSDKPAKELKKYETLNKAFIAQKISLDQYAESLRQADIAFAQSEFAKGKISLFERNEKQNEAALSRFNQQLSFGIMSVEEYNQAVNNLKANELKEKLDAGVISLKEYDSSLVAISDKLGNEGAFRVGIRNYLESIGTLSSNIAGAVENAFGTLEDAFFEFTMKGKRDFADMTQSILDELSRIIIRASIIRPLAGGLDSLLTGMFTAESAGGGGGSGPAQVRMQFNAKGGVIESPTFLGYSKGRAQIGGESGPEAVLPLSRGSNGSLGVSASVTPVTINVINNAGVGIEQQESVGPDGSKTLDLIITSKVKEGIATGAFDRAFSSTYGLKRRGV